MGRRNIVMVSLLALALASVSAACGDDGAERAAQEDELDRQLDMALRGDSAPIVFEDVAVVEEAPAAPPAEQPRPAAPQTQRQTTAPPPRATQPPAPVQTQPRPAAPQPRTVTRSVPVGTTFAATMNNELSTETSKVGDAFTATLSAPIVDAQGTVIIPAGATVRGRVTAVQPSTRVGQTAALSLAFEAISFGGQSYPFQGTIQRADVQQKSRTGRTETAGKIAAGAAAGAILGRVLGGSTESTLKGAAVGAAAGTAIAMGTADVDAVLPRGAEIVIRTDQPITVTRTVAG